ncbi:helix-turn-helix domain-containing protein [Pseudomonas sp.]|uniref:helix-turn-helix domain-containing protein n=1 Tax=Pseudomonas sp. TaxID=306 RepID=UPI0039C9A9F4
MEPKIPRDDPVAVWEWVKYQLRIKGVPMAELARRHRVTPQAFARVKRVPYPRMERVIAKALQLRPIDIWPKRWTCDSVPVRQRPTRAEKRAYKTELFSATNAGGNPKMGNAASSAQNGAW